VWIGKGDRAEALDEVDPVAPDVTGQVFLIVSVASDAGAVREDGTQIWGGRLAFKPE
jgi:hypothetical protein